MTDNYFSSIKHRYTSRKPQEMTMTEFLEGCKNDPTFYATPSERMLTAIGPAETVDTREDPRMSRIFQNRKIRLYKTFEKFYGMEDTVDNVVKFFTHASQDLEESKQILYLLGPVGGGKSSLVERLKELFETVPFYTLKAGDQISPHYESPFGLFDYNEDAAHMAEKYNIPRRVLKPIMSPWASKRLAEFDGDPSKFKVVKMWPSITNRVGIAKAEPGDENNQDTSVLIGKVDIRKLEDFSQDDPDAYSYSGALNVTAQGLFDYVEMFKANIKMLNPLLTATQEHHYNGTEGFGAMPFGGLLVAHSNESEWELFRNNKRNEAFIDRMYTVKVPYCLRVSDEVRIYEKLISSSTLAGAKIAPGTLEMLGRFAVLGRLKDPENSNLFTKMEVYDGKDVKEKNPDAKALQEYRDDAGVNEGMDGPSTRFGFKILSKTINYDAQEIAANPVHLMYILIQQIKEENFPKEVEDKYMGTISGILGAKYYQFLSDEIQKAYIESYSEYGQNLFDQYINYADAWIQKNDFRDPETGEMYDLEHLNSVLEKIEKPAGIANPKDFRNEVVNFVLRARANNAGKVVEWSSYEKMRTVIEKKIFANTEEMLPVIAFNKKSSNEEEGKHSNFVQRMTDKGYTEKQVRLLVEWFMRYRRHQ